MEFGKGNHTVGLQWKKSSGGIVTSWSNQPSSHDGFAGGRSIVVTAQVSAVVSQNCFLHIPTVSAKNQSIEEGSFPSQLPKRFHSSLLQREVAIFSDISQGA